MGIGDVRGGQPQPDLSLTDALSSQEAQELVAYGQNLASDGLSTMEKEHLEQKLQLLIDSPNLPAPDKDALKNWKAKLEQALTTGSQDSTVDLFDARIHQSLLSSDPQVAMDAFSSLGGLDNQILTPAQKTLLKEGVAKIAVKLSQLKSGDPEQLKAEIRALLKEAFKEILEKNGEHPSDEELDALVGQFGSVIDEVAENMGLLNLAAQETILYSTNAADIYQALLSASNLMFFPPDKIVMDKLEDISVQIAAANSRGTPIEEFGSKNPTIVADKLRQMMNLNVNDANYQALSAIADSVGSSIAATNVSKQHILDGDDNHAMALLLAAHAEATGSAAPDGGPGGLPGVGGAGGGGGPPPVYLSDTPKTNPYLTPGIMARLAPILSELAKIYTEMIKQSSELKQNMMALVASMAVESFNFSIRAGQAKVKMLEIEISEAWANVGIAAVSLAVTVASFAYQRASMKQFDDVKKPEFKTAKNDEYVELQNKANGGTPADQTRLDNFKNQYCDKNGGISDSKIDRAYNVSSERSTHFTQVESSVRLFTAGKDSLVQMTQNAVKAIMTGQKIGLTMDQATAEGMEKLISQVIQTIMDTMRTAGEEGQRADKDWQAFNQLFREIASTITSGLYR
jgi:hypothetical protein